MTTPQILYDWIIDEIYSLFLLHKIIGKVLCPFPNQKPAERLVWAMERLTCLQDLAKKESPRVCADPDGYGPSRSIRFYRSPDMYHFAPSYFTIKLPTLLPHTLEEFFKSHKYRSKKIMADRYDHTCPAA